MDMTATSRSKRRIRNSWPIVSLALVLALPGATAWAADFYSSASPIRIGEDYTSASLASYSTEGGEGMAYDSSYYCPEETSYRTFATDWTRVIGNGRRLTATVSADWDNLIGLFPNTIADPNLCNVERSGVDNPLAWDSAWGAAYNVQVGGCLGNDTYPCDLSPDVYAMRVTSAPPANDARANAISHAPGDGQKQYDNHGAGIAGEGSPQCASVSPPSSFRSTVWFKFTPDRFGTATFTATEIARDPIDTVLAVYRESEAEMLGCDDTPTDSSGAAQVTVPVAKGVTYFVQVGSYGTLGAMSAQGTFTYTSTFSTDNDDGDPERNESDCADDDPGRYHGATEVFNNDVDEDCDGRDDKDFDNDGFDFQPVGPDCNDRDAAISPKALEIAGNREDENCDNLRPAAALSPSPAVQLFSSLVRRRGRIFGDTRIVGVAAGYRVTLVCKGRGCGKRRRKVIVVRKGTSVRTKWTTGAILRKNARFEISIVLPGANRIGVYQRNGVSRKLRAVTRTCDLEPTTVDGTAFRRNCGSG